MARSDINIGLTLADLDNPEFTRRAACPLGMYLKLLSWVWRSASRPTHPAAPPLHWFYVRGLLASWAFDNTLAETFDVPRRTIIRWRKELRNSGLVVTVGQPGAPAAYVLGRWEQRTHDHWACLYLWETDVLAAVNHVLANWGCDKNVTGSYVFRTFITPPCDKNVTPPCDKNVTPPCDKNVTQEELTVEELTEKNNRPAARIFPELPPDLWRVAQNDLVSMMSIPTWDSIVGPLTAQVTDGHLVIIGSKYQIAWASDRMARKIQQAVDAAAGRPVIIEWQEAA